MRFALDIRHLADGRPDGVVEVLPDGSHHAFCGWVDLLRILEQHCDEGPFPHGPDSGDQ